MEQSFNREVYTYVVEVPVSGHKIKEVVDVEEALVRNLMDYTTFEEVLDVGQIKIGSRWVIKQSEKQDGQKQSESKDSCSRL